MKCDAVFIILFKGFGVGPEQQAGFISALLFEYIQQISQDLQTHR